MDEIKVPYTGVSFFPAKRVLAIFLFVIFIRNWQTSCRRDSPKPIIRSRKRIPFPTQFLFLEYLERSTQIKKSHESSKKLIQEKIKHLKSKHGTEKNANHCMFSLLVFLIRLLLLLTWCNCRSCNADMQDRVRALFDVYGAELIVRRAISRKHI